MMMETITHLPIREGNKRLSRTRKYISLRCGLFHGPAVDFMGGGNNTLT